MPKLSPLLENQAVNWWKHGAYELRDGCIAPCKGASAKVYDPWLARSDADRGELLTQALNDLLAIIPTEKTAPLEVEDVLRWSLKYGPLGVLPQRILFVRFHPEPLTERDVIQRDLSARRQGSAATLNGDKLAGVTSSSLWFQGRWRKKKELVPAGADRRQYPAGVLLRARTAFGSGPPFVELPLKQAFAPYFQTELLKPGVSNSYPEPGSPAFRDAYREPLDEWTHWARMLASALEDINEPSEPMVWHRGAATLSWLAQPTAAVLEQLATGSDECRIAARAPSLLSSLAAVAMQRVPARTGARVCKDPDCGRMFLPSNPRAEYHSNECRWRHTKEVARARKPTTKPRKTKARTKEKAEK